MIQEKRNDIDRMQNYKGKTQQPQQRPVLQSLSSTWFGKSQLKASQEEWEVNGEKKL